jgi:hypothetical protein
MSRQLASPLSNNSSLLYSIEEQKEYLRQHKILLDKLEVRAKLRYFFLCEQEGNKNLSWENFCRIFEASGLPNPFLTAELCYHYQTQEELNPTKSVKIELIE